MNSEEYSTGYPRYRDRDAGVRDGDTDPGPGSGADTPLSPTATDTMRRELHRRIAEGTVPAPKAPPAAEHPVTVEQIPAGEHPSGPLPTIQPPTALPSATPLLAGVPVPVAVPAAVPSPPTAPVHPDDPAGHPGPAIPAGTSTGQPPGPGIPTEAGHQPGPAGTSAWAAHEPDLPDAPPHGMRPAVARESGGEPPTSPNPNPNPAGAEGAGGTPRSVGSGGRHARRDGGVPPPGAPRLDYVPKHSLNSPGLVSPTAVTDVFSRVRQDPTERPMPARPESEPFDGEHEREDEVPPPPQVTRVAGGLYAPTDDSATYPPGKRVRVVLSSRKGHARPVRTVVDVQELTQVGEVLTNSLIRSQLALALRIGGIALITLGALPAMFHIFPILGRFELFGIRLPWLLLGGLAYPFLLGLGWMYSRSAERLEQVFADHIQS